ncbi:MAG: ABC transporter ATP-binding protein [Eubacterium sp.]|nr:ABC transporter ATP-binding protein [Eubacterium sp.]
MIEIKNIVKLFGDKKALDNISFSIGEGSVFGLVGSNGAGKSTLLRILAGVFYPDGGDVFIDGSKPFENPAVKCQCAFVSDFPYFYSGATLDTTALYYSSVYPSWDNNRYNELKKLFPINSVQKIASMSKGMQRQSAIILALSYNPKYIFFDEIFDGLDPVIRELVKKILIDYVDKTGATVVIASHNLRELEGFCDHIGLLHLGGVLFESDIDGEQMSLYRYQFVMEENDYIDIKPQLNITKESRQGKVIEITVKGDKSIINEIINSKNPVYVESLPLTLEELFISEMEVAGYDINNLKL